MKAVRLATYRLRTIFGVLVGLSVLLASTTGPEELAEVAPRASILHVQAMLAEMLGSAECSGEALNILDLQRLVSEGFVPETPQVPSARFPVAQLSAQRGDGCSVRWAAGLPRRPLKIEYACNVPQPHARKPSRRGSLKNGRERYLEALMPHAPPSWEQARLFPQT
jgi:hypothetical protein